MMRTASSRAARRAGDVGLGGAAARGAATVVVMARNTTSPVHKRQPWRRGLRGRRIRACPVRHRLMFVHEVPPLQELSESHHREPPSSGRRHQDHPRPHGGPYGYSAFACREGQRIWHAFEGAASVPRHATGAPDDERLRGAAGRFEQGLARKLISGRRNTCHFCRRPSRQNAAGNLLQADSAVAQTNMPRHSVQLQRAVRAHVPTRVLLRGVAHTRNENAHGRVTVGVSLALAAEARCDWRALIAVAHFHQQPQDLQVQPDQGHKQTEGPVPLHVLRHRAVTPVSMKSKSSTRFSAAITTTNSEKPMPTQPIG